MAYIDPIRHKHPEHVTRPSPGDGHDTFYEAMPGVADANFTYDDELADSNFHPVSSTLRGVTVILTFLLVLRILVTIFEPDRSIPLINLLLTPSDWLTVPFIMLVSQTPISGLGYLDWPGVVALAIVTLIGWMLTNGARMARL